LKAVSNARDPVMIQVVKDIRDNLHALRIQFFVTIKTTVATTRLGVLWWILDPLILMVLYTFVVKIVFDRGGPNYHLFALCGIVTWQSFGRSVTLCSTALTRNSSLIKQTKLPMHLYVILPPIVQSFFYLIGLLIVAIWNNSVVGWHTLSILLLLLPMILIPYTLGLFLSIFTVKIADIGKMVPYALRFGFYISPVLYPPERVYALKNIPPFLKSLYALNPMVHVITAVRDVLFTGTMFNLTAMVVILAVTLVLMQMGMLYFRSFSVFVPKEL
jgi:lipopolysaccharide transport system permease protein